MMPVELIELYTKLSRDDNQRFMNWHGPGVRLGLQDYEEKHQCVLKAMVKLINLQVTEEE